LPGLTVSDDDDDDDDEQGYIKMKARHSQHN
jgi:hypothetical protein